MAIKVNGTTVINDSRQLQNVASVDATTVAALGAAGVGGFTETSFSRPTSGTGLLTTLVPATWRNSQTHTTAPTASDGLVASWTLTSSKVLAALTIKSDMSKITWTQVGYFSGGMYLWLYNPELPSGEQYINILGNGTPIFDIGLGGGDTPPAPANINISKSLTIYGANSVLYLIGGRMYNTTYGGITCAANFLSVDSYTSSVS